MLGPKLWLIVLTVGALARAARRPRRRAAPRSRSRSATSSRPPRRSASRASRSCSREILPNITSPLLVEFGLRLTYSVGPDRRRCRFLGFGMQPPAADWGLMINENRLGCPVQPWAVFVPVALIAILTIGINLVTDGLSRAMIGIERDTGASMSRIILDREGPARSTLDPSGVEIDRRGQFRARRRARCSAWSASRARARPRSATSLLDFQRRGAASRAAPSRSTAATCSRSAPRSSASCAAASSATCRRTPARRSTRRCASACSCARSSRCTASARRAADREARIDEMMAEVVLPCDQGVPAALPAPALRRPAAARRPSPWPSPAGPRSSCSTSPRRAST